MNYRIQIMVAAKNLPSALMYDFLTENAAHLAFVTAKGSYTEGYAQEKGIPIIFG